MVSMELRSSGIAKAARGARGLAGHFNTWLTTVTDADRSPQRPGVDQDSDDSLCHADQGQQQKLGIVEDGERSDTGRSESEKQHLNGCDGGHKNGFNRVVDARMRDP